VSNIHEIKQSHTYPDGQKMNFVGLSPWFILFVSASWPLFCTPKIPVSGPSGDLKVTWAEI